MPNCKNQKFNHNFVGGKCLKCGINQLDLSYPLKEKKIKYEPTPTSYRISTPLHLLARDIRKEFGETAKKGKGNFGYYMKFFKKLGEQKIREIYSQSKEGNNRKHLFWWLIGKETKMKRI